MNVQINKLGHSPYKMVCFNGNIIGVFKHGTYYRWSEGLEKEVRNGYRQRTVELASGVSGSIRGVEQGGEGTDSAS